MVFNVELDKKRKLLFVEWNEFLQECQVEGNSEECKGIVYEKRPSHFFAVIVSLVHPLSIINLYIAAAHRENKSKR